MLKTLGLDDDLDSVEVVIAIEKAFDVEISSGEAEAVFNVGQLFELLRGKVHAVDANRKCASAMALYRIRRALNDLGLAIGRSSSYDLSRLHHVYTKSFVKCLQERSGLRLPQPAPQFGRQGRYFPCLVWGVGCRGGDICGSTVDVHFSRCRRAASDCFDYSASWRAGGRERARVHRCRPPADEQSDARGSCRKGRKPELWTSPQARR
jgi:hypothetical protein